MIIYWDVTKTGFTKIKSGINRVSRCLQDAVVNELPKNSIVPVVWNHRKGDFETVDKPRRSVGRADELTVFITVEVFSEEERPGFLGWLKNFHGMRCIVFHDAIPLQYPEFTWPHSVSRHPHYMKMLLSFDNVYAVSDYSLNIVRGYLYWLDASMMPGCHRVYLGANFNDSARKQAGLENRSRELVMTGIVEPRKNQSLLLDAVKILSKESLDFQVRFIGRVNPNFGKPIVKRMKEMKKAGYPIDYEYAVSDERMKQIYDEALFSVFPSLTEGCGLPVLESLWAGLPVVASDIPSVVENGSKGIRFFENNDAESLAKVLKELLSSENELRKFYNETDEQILLSWKESGSLFVESLKANMQKADYSASSI